MNSTAMHIVDIVGNRLAAPTTSSAAGRAGQHPGGTKETSKPDVTVEGSALYDRADLANAVDKINEKVQRVLREIKFSVDDKSDRVVIKVIDQQTKEVIREIPPEQIIEMAQDLDKSQGMLLHEKA